jgi:uncharacterized protein YbaR (Trm112 family)
VHLLLTDRLTCPRCGPEFGLILLAHRLEDRVVHEGVLGCPNCRDGFPVTRGLGDLRAPPRGDVGPGFAGDPGSIEGDDVARLLAQLGVLGGPGTIALVGEPARAAAGVAAALPEIQVAAIDADLIRWPETERVSRLVAAPGLPFYASILRAVALDGRLGPEWLAEAARVVAPRGRVVVVRAGEGVVERLASMGLREVASDGETVVAARS